MICDMYRYINSISRYNIGFWVYWYIWVGMFTKSDFSNLHKCNYNKLVCWWISIIIRWPLQQNRTFYNHLNLLLGMLCIILRYFLATIHNNIELYHTSLNQVSPRAIMCHTRHHNFKWPICKCWPAIKRLQVRAPLGTGFFHPWAYSAPPSKWGGVCHLILRRGCNAVSPRELVNISNLCYSTFLVSHIWWNTCRKKILSWVLLQKTLKKLYMPQKLPQSLLWASGLLLLYK